jgi:hypothetical protein
MLKGLEQARGAIRGRGTKPLNARAIVSLKATIKSIKTRLKID